MKKFFKKRESKKDALQEIETSKLKKLEEISSSLSKLANCKQMDTWDNADKDSEINQLKDEIKKTKEKNKELRKEIKELKRCKK